jgi:hypothetical protein
MSETTPEPTPTEPAANESTTPEATQAFTQEQVNALLAEQKRKERERFAGFDDLKAKAAEFDKLQEASKSEQQRAADAARQAQEEAQAARSEALRYKAAATHGIGEDYFDLLGSGDAETITARAERVGGLLRENATLKAEIEALRAGKPAPTTGTPVAALKPGATPENNQSEDDVLYSQLFGNA